jgi:hypothetical protein
VAAPESEPPLELLDPELPDPELPDPEVLDPELPDPEPLDPELPDPPPLELGWPELLPLAADPLDPELAALASEPPPPGPPDSELAPESETAPDPEPGSPSGGELGASVELHAQTAVVAAATAMRTRARTVSLPSRRGISSRRRDCRTTATRETARNNRNVQRQDRLKSVKAALVQGRRRPPPPGRRAYSSQGSDALAKP